MGREGKGGEGRKGRKERGGWERRGGEWGEKGVRFFFSADLSTLVTANNAFTLELNICELNC